MRQLSSIDSLPNVKFPGQRLPGRSLEEMSLAMFAVRAKMSKDEESAKEISNAAEIISDILFCSFQFSRFCFSIFSPSHSLSFGIDCALFCFIVGNAMRESQSPKLELERALELKMELAAGRMPKQVATEDEGMSRGSVCVCACVSLCIGACVCVCVLMIVTVQRLGD